MTPIESDQTVGKSWGKKQHLMHGTGNQTQHRQHAHADCSYGSFPDFLTNPDKFTRLWAGRTVLDQRRGQLHLRPVRADQMERDMAADRRQGLVPADDPAGGRGHRRAEGGRLVQRDLGGGVVDASI